MDSEKPACIGDHSTWDAGYGTCDTYAISATNHNLCHSDCDTNNQCAFQVCEECRSCSVGKQGIARVTVDRNFQCNTDIDIYIH